MAKASLNIPNGPSVQIEGTPEEIQELLSFYSKQQQTSPAREQKTTKSAHPESSAQTDMVNHAEIANQIKQSEEASVIAEQILDKRDQTNRVLLPLFIVHEYFENRYALTTGDISKILGNVGIKISNSHVADELGDSSSRYVIGDRIKSKGVRIKYKISRPGVQRLKAVLSVNRIAD